MRARTGKPPWGIAHLQFVQNLGDVIFHCSFTALSGIGFADILIFIQLGFKSALLDSNTGLPSLLQADLLLVSRQAQNFGQLDTFPRRRLFQAKNIPEIESADPLYVSVGAWKNPQTKKESSLVILGFNPGRPAFNLPEINQNLKIIQYPDVLLFDRGSDGEYKDAIAQIAQGNPVSTELQGRKITVKGLYRVGASFIADGSVITSDQNFLRIYKDRTAGEVSMGLITLKSGSDASTVAAKLRSQLPDDVKVFTRQEFVIAERKYLETGTSIGFIFTFGVVVGFVVGVIIVYQILFSNVTEHLAEYATLKAMGYSNGYLLGVVFQEAIILAISGFFPGCLIAVGLYGVTSSVTSLPLVMTLGRVIQVLVLTIIMCAASATIAVEKLRAADPADVF